ncbi:MAG: cyclic nucleotide-binding domain-containing protein [Pseudorhodoferax sp.]
MSHPSSPADAWPERAVPAGTVLIQEAERSDHLYVLRQGAFDIVRAGVRIVQVREPGAFLGEIAPLLDTPATASVIAARDSLVQVIHPAAAAVRSDPALTLAIAQLLARRLQTVTAYLVDLQQQYAGTGTHLALMDQVLARLMEQQPRPPQAPGSERADVPDY